VLDGRISFPKVLWYGSGSASPRVKWDAVQSGWLTDGLRRLRTQRHVYEVWMQLCLFAILVLQLALGASRELGEHHGEIRAAFSKNLAEQDVNATHAWQPPAPSSLCKSAESPQCPTDPSSFDS
jgi:hypothetical protein